METVKVDTQKLQLLNDRIAQTIDALNQLKMSVHGIQHSPVSPYYAANPYYQSYPSPAAFAPQFNPYAQPFVPQYAAPGFMSPAGIQHTTTLSPLRGWTTVPTFAQALPPTYAQTVPTYAPTLGQTTFGNTFGNGISHTEWDPAFARQAWTTTPWSFQLS